MWLPQSNQRNDHIELFKDKYSGNTWSGEYMNYYYKEEKDLEELRREREKFKKYDEMSNDFKKEFTREMFEEVLFSKPSLKIQNSNDRLYKEWIQKEFFDNYFFHGIDSVNTGKTHIVFIKCKNNEYPPYPYAVSIEFELDKQYSLDEAKIKAYEAIAEAISLRTKTQEEIIEFAEA